MLANSSLGIGFEVKSLIFETKRLVPNSSRPVLQTTDNIIMTRAGQCNEIAKFG